MLNNFLFFESRAVYEIMWNKYCRAGQTTMTIWCIGIAYWKPKATNTHSAYNTYCLSTATMDARTHLNVTLYVHSMSMCYMYDILMHICIVFLQCWELQIDVCC